MATMAQSLGKQNVRSRGGHLRRYHTTWGFLFISPWVIGFLLFGFIPFLASFVFSTYDFQLASPDETAFIGFENWRRLLFEDPTVWESLAVTFAFALISLLPSHCTRSGRSLH